MMPATAMPKEFFAWFANHAAVWVGRPWLLIGKGPTFSRLHETEVDEYFTLGLNHVVRQTRLTVAHAIDIDVIASCADVLEENAEYVVMPWFPHEENRAGEKTLLQWIEEIPVLQRLASAGRLLWYNASTARVAAPDAPVVHVMYFSAEAALNLLALAGVRRVRTLGVDGGASYSSEFAATGTLLANGRASFNKQFDRIAKTIMAYSLDYAPLYTEAPIKIFVAATEAQMLAVKVLEYSIRKHASMTVEVVPLHLVGIDIPRPKDERNWPRTPFSFQRFIIPEACAYKGRAIYLDSDMQVFSDIRQLWEMPLQGNALISAQDAKEGGRKPQYSVMLLDCARLDWDIKKVVASMDAGGLSYESLMYDMSVANEQAALIPAEWNSLESYSVNQTRLLHYTDMDTQPWVYTNNPNGYLWCQDLFEAIRDGYIDASLLDEHIAKGWVRPSLRYQFDQGIVDPMLLPRGAAKSDADFLAPFLGIHAHRAKPWQSLRGLLIAFSRRIYLRTPLPRFVRKFRTYVHRYE